MYMRIFFCGPLMEWNNLRCWKSFVREQIPRSEFHAPINITIFAVKIVPFFNWIFYRFKSIQWFSSILIYYIIIFRQFSRFNHTMERSVLIHTYLQMCDFFFFKRLCVLWKRLYSKRSDCRNAIIQISLIKWKFSDGRNLIYAIQIGFCVFFALVNVSRKRWNIIFPIQFIMQTRFRSICFNMR